MTSNENRTLVIRFRVEGRCRYLSHQETMTMFQRALRRSGLELRYSQGYNPRIKVSVPLPRSVAVASEDELICVSVVIDASSTPADDLKAAINRQLPAGCEVVGVEVAATNARFQAVRAVYEFGFDSSVLAGQLDDRISRLSAGIASGDAMVVERRCAKGRSSRQLDVGRYLRSVKRDGQKVVFICEITPAGTIRVDEMLELLGMGTHDVRGPIRRRSVEWKQ